MKDRKPKFYAKMVEGDSTRTRSDRQESRLAKELRGRTTINSGATLGQNDIETDFCEIEAKTTKKESFSLSLADWRKLTKKCDPKKIPLMVVDFETSKHSLAVINYDDLLYLIERANAPTEL